MIEGTVQLWKEREQYGFINGSDGGNYYFNDRGLRNRKYQPHRRDKVTFEAAPGFGKERAIKVALVKTVETTSEGVDWSHWPPCYQLPKESR